MPAGGGWEVEAGSSGVLERAPQGMACISPRGRRGSQGHRAGKALQMAPSARGWQASRAQHARESRPGQIRFLSRAEPWIEFKDIYLLDSNSQTQVYTRHCCGQNRIQFYFSGCRAPRTPSDWLGRSVLGLLLLSYTHIIHTYIFLTTCIK